MTDYKDKPVSNINPSHYRSDDIECIEVVRHMSFCQGNAIKYLWRLGQKDAAEQELKKALWYMDDLLEHNWPGTVVNIIDIDKDIYTRSIEYLHSNKQGRKASVKQALSLLIIGNIAGAKQALSMLS